MAFVGVCHGYHVVSSLLGYGIWTVLKCGFGQFEPERYCEGSWYSKLVKFHFPKG